MTSRAPESAWHGRPGLARLIKTIATIGPIVIAIGSSLLLGRALPPATSFRQAVMLWLVLATVSSVVLIVVERGARRLLPLSALLKLTLVFPDQAPSRYKVARGTATTRQLTEEVERARQNGLGDDRTAAAESVLRLVAALSVHDRGTRGHAERTRIFTDMIADELDLPKGDVDRLRWAALLHDVGKIAVHTDILNKPGKPSDEEWAALRSHPEEGAKLIAPLRSWLGPWAVTVDQHHEQWDGSGYPAGLTGTDISLGARIVAVADAYDVMTAARPYKKPRTATAARQELADCAGSHFDPHVVRAFLRIAVGRLRWAAGPLSWLSSAAGVRILPQVGANAGLATSLFVAGLGAIALAPQAAIVDDVAVEIAAEAPPASLAEPFTAPTVAPTPAVSPTATPTPTPTPTLAPLLTPVPVPLQAPTPTPLPTPGDRELVVDEDTPGQVQLFNELTAPGQTMQLQSVTEPDPAFGRVRWDTAGTVVFIPAADASGRSVISYTAIDGARTVSGAVTLVVLSVNDAPSARRPDTVTAASDGSTIRIPSWLQDITTGPADESDQQLEILVETTGPVAFTQPPAVDRTGQLTFQPALGAAGDATITVTLVDDGGTRAGGIDRARFVATIAVARPDEPTPATAPNAPPRFTPGTGVAIAEDSGPQSVAAWATGITPGDASEAGQTISFTTTTTNPSLFAVAPKVNAAGDLSYAPAADAVGTASVTVTLTDNGSPAASTSSTFTITVDEVNDAPAFVKGPDQTPPEDVPAVTIGGWATGITAGPASESSQTVSFSTSTTNDALFAALPAIDSTTGDMSYTLATNAVGTATVTVTLTDDGTPVATVSDSFTITVTPINDKPAFVKGPDQTVAEDAAAQSIAGWATGITAGPADESAQALGFSISTTNASLFSVAPAIDEATGDLTYTPAANAVGTATVTVTLTDDGSPAASTSSTFTIAINEVNDAPTFTVGADQTLLEDAAAQTVAGWATGITAGPASESAQTVSFTTTTTNDVLFAVLPAVDQITGGLTYTPAANAVGTATVTVTLTDDGTPVETVSNSFTVTLTEVNDAPTFKAGANQTLLEDAAAQTIAGWATGITAGPASESSQTVAFTTTTTNDPLFAVLPAIDQTTGDLTYTLAADAVGTATVTVTLTDDGAPAGTVSDSFTIIAWPVNDDPAFAVGANQTVAEDAGAQTVVGWATGITAGPANESAQARSFTTTTTNDPLFAVAPAIDAITGDLTYTPAADAVGSAVVTVTLTDDGSPAGSTSSTFTITISGANDAPTFTAGAGQTLLEGAAAQTIAAWATGITAGPASESAQTVAFSTTTSNDSLFAVAPAIDETTGDLTYTPAADAVGTATVTVTLTDDGAPIRAVSDSFTITLTEVNDAPSFTVGANQTVAEDAAAQTTAGWATGITAGPISESSQTVAFSTTTTNDSLFAVAPAIDETTGDLTYTPAADAVGTATVTVTLTDNGTPVETSSDTFTVTVTAVNDDPAFTKGADQSVAEDTAAQTIAAWATGINAGPVHEATQTVTFSTTTSNDPLFAVLPAVDEATGDLTYTPAANAVGTATVTITLTDDGTPVGTVSDSFTITLTEVNDAPTFTAGADQTPPEDVPAVTIGGWATGITAGPASESPQTVSFSTTTTNDALFAVLPAVDTTTGDLSYELAADAVGTATVTITLTDDGAPLGTVSDSFTITVTAINDAPTFAKGADQTVAEDTAAQAVTAWATGIAAGPADESTQTITFSTTTTNDSLFAVAPAVDEATGDLTYTPAANAVGTATVTVTLTDDGTPAATSTDTFVITLTEVNDAPTFTAGANLTPVEDAVAQTVAGWATGITPGPSSESSQTVAFSTTTTNDSLFAVLPAVDETTGDLTYTLAADAVGTATVTVTLTDNGSPIRTASDTFTITVTAVNDDPTFVAGANQTVTEDTAAQSIAAWATGIAAGPVDESTQTVTFSTTTTNNPLFAVAPAIDEATGDLTYTPAANAVGTATVTVTLTDNGSPIGTTSDTFTITITEVNDAPTFTTGANQTPVEDAAAQTIAGWATGITAGPGSESGQTVAFSTTTTNDSLFAVLPAVDETTGDLTYTLAADAVGTATVTVTLTDDGTPAGTVNDTFTITVTAVNDAPTFTAGANQAVAEDAAAQTIPAWATGITAGPADESTQTLTFSTTTTNEPLFAVLPTIDEATGDLTYTPAANAVGTATVTVTLTDNGSPTETATDTFTITISEVNDAPTFTTGANQTPLEDAAAQTIAGWATGITAGPGSESGQTVAFSTTTTNDSLFAVLPAVDETTGDLTYALAANAVGTATVTVTLTDDGTPAGTVTDTFTITVTAVNDDPTFSVGANQAVAEDASPQTIAAWATGITTGPADESTQTITFSTTTTNDSLFAVLPAIDEATGDLTYTPAANAVGTATVTVTLTDNGSPIGTTSDTFTITITEANDAPTFTTGANQAVDEDAAAQTVAAWATDVTAGPASESAQTVTFSTATTNDSLFATIPAVDETTGDLTYALAANAVGTATVTVTLTDDGTPAGTVTDTFTITATAVNDAPTFAVGADQTVAEDTAAQTVAAWATGITAGPADESTQTLTFSTTTTNNPLFAAAPAIDEATGDLTYTPAANAVGAATVTVTLTDDGSPAATSTDTFTITVNEVNDAPSFTKGADIKVSQDSGLSTTAGWATAISAGPASEAGQTLTFTATPQDATLFDGAITISSAGALAFTPAAGAVGTTSVAVTLSDSGGGADTSAGQTFDITIVPASATGMVISQLAFGGMNGAGGDFIEIYNAGPSITLNGWSLHLVDDDITNLVSVAIPDGTTIDRGEHWLFAAGLVDGVAANQVIVFPTWFPTADPANPLGVGLYDGAAYVDQVGNRGSVHFSVNAAKLSEGSGLSVLEAVSTDRSWERRNGGSAGHCIDTADNGADFTLNFGAANVVPHNNLNDDDCGALPAPPAAANTLVISEFRHDGDGAGDNDFVEIFNPTPIDVDVADWFLHVTDGGGGEHVEFTFPAATTIRGGEHFLIGGASFVGADASFSGDGIKGDTRIRLKEVGGTLVDEVSMGVVSGGSVDPLPKLGGRQDHSYHRLHDGCTDTDSNYDDFEYLGTSTPTPMGALSPCPNAAPAAVDDPLTAGAYDTPNDVNLVVAAADGVLANDSDVDLDALVVLPGVPVPPTNGALTLNADGSFTYDPDAGFAGIDSFTYTVSDGALSSTATAYITVGPP